MEAIPTPLIHRVLPPQQSSAGSHPALIMLHGRGADEEDLLGLVPMLDERLFILSVRAPFPFDASGGYTWYDVGDIGTPDPAMFRMSYEQLVAFLEDARTRYPIDPGRLFLFGFSMGTVMSLALALTLPQLFRGVVANSGYIPEQTTVQFKWKELQNTAFFLTHGTADPVIPVDFARRAKALFSQSNAPFEYREYPMAHQISEESIANASRWLTKLIDL